MRENIFKNKSVLVTGGTGSFGRAFIKRLLVEDQCKKAIIFSRDEWKQWEIKESDPIYRHPKIRYFLGDVRDVNRLNRAFFEVDYVVHAAALKQVPAAEYNPSEFVKTNVMGAMNIIDAAISSGVEKVVALSTDKAVNPINLYGATKLCSDKLFCAANSYVGPRSKPQFSVVRYGNVLGSRGSILPHWQTLLAKGDKELPITDVRMTRFWITLDQSVDLVMQCFGEMRSGEIFVPKIPSMKITDLAHAIAPNIPLKTIGIRPGEKLNEMLMSSDEARHALEFDSYFLILPEYIIENENLLAKFIGNRDGKRLPESFSYSSDNNPKWLDAEALRKLL
jgi:UDP-N-acetylglucosamine 4,6-dehydratase